MRNKYLHIQLFITSYIKNKKEQRTHFACNFFEFALSLIANRYSISLNNRVLISEESNKVTFPNADTPKKNERLWVIVKRVPL